MAGRKAKVTTNKKDRKYQRERTKQLQAHDADLKQLNTSPPDSLNGVAVTAYKWIANELNSQNLIKEIDAQVVISLCRQIQIAEVAYEEIFGGDDPEGIQQPIYKAVQDSSGQVLEHQFIGYKKNPAVNTLDSATAKIKSLCETLGMTPSSRASLLEAVKPEDETGDDIKASLNAVDTDF